MENLWGEKFMWKEGGKQAMKITKIVYKNATVKE